MLRSILPHPTSDHLFTSDVPPGGEGGAGGGTPLASPAPPAPQGVPQDKVDEIVKGRVADTKKATEEAIAKQLGVTVAEAQAIIKTHNERTDAEKTEAQRARDAADAEKAEAERSKGESAQEAHAAKVERAILRSVKFPEDMSDEDLDKKVGRIARLVEAEVGASAEDIASAVKALKDDEPLLFGAEASGGGNGSGQPGVAATGDPKGNPSRQTGTEGAYEKGLKRASSAGSGAQYPILAGSLPDTPTT